MRELIYEVLQVFWNRGSKNKQMWPCGAISPKNIISTWCTCIFIVSWTEDFREIFVGKSSRNLLTAEVEFVNKMHTRPPRTEDLGNNILYVIES